ncbi:hypothetical protein WP12_12110 [Sphingomonas sp. SRS2]|nr:hypothetical protein WP12_12110 [Sphingomonas sp. SRS2]
MSALYRPSNGSEGRDFMNRWCGVCERDRAFREGEGDSCEIAAMTMAVSVDDPAYPREWRQDGPNGPRCTAYEGDAHLDPSAVVARLL